MASSDRLDQLPIDSAQDDPKALAVMAGIFQGPEDAGAFVSEFQLAAVASALFALLSSDLCQNLVIRAGARSASSSMGVRVAVFALLFWMLQKKLSDH